MKLEILLDNFSKGLSLALKAVSAKATLPVLSNVLLETDKGRLKITATDLEKTISVWVGAKIEQDGATTVPARILYEFVSSLKPAPLQLVKEGSLLVIKSEGVSSKFATMPAEEFPKTLPLDSYKKLCSVERELFLDALSKVSFASSSDDTRPVLSGIKISQEEDTLTFVAVDGFRLAERKIQLKSKVDLNTSFIVPSKSLSEAFRIFSVQDKQISLGFFEKENTFCLEGGDAFVTVRLLEGEFPEYQKIIPADFSHEATVLKDDLIQGIKLAGVFAKDDSKIVKLELSKEKVAIKSESQEMGEAQAEFKAQVTGEDVIIAFNAKFLLDFLVALPSKEDLLVSLKTAGALSPALFRLEKQENYLYVVMPVRVQ